MRTLLLAALLLAPATAFAQPAKAADVDTMVTDDCARAHKLGKTCIIKIEDEEVEGGGIAPHEIEVNVATFTDHNSLIKIRRDFIPEILRTAEDID